MKFSLNFLIFFGIFIYLFKIFQNFETKSTNLLTNKSLLSSKSKLLTSSSNKLKTLTETNSKTETKTTTESKTETKTETEKSKVFFRVDKSLLKTKKASSTETTINNSKTHDGQIIWTGWIKYIKFNEDQSDKPSHFFKNNQYIAQMQSNPSINLDEKLTNNKNDHDYDHNNEKDYIYIRSETDFFAFLFEKNLNIITNRLVNDFLICFRTN